MNLEDPAVIKASIEQAQSAIDASITKAVADFSTAASDLIIEGTKHFSETLIECFQQALADAEKLLAEQDGWTLEIAPIEIPKIVIRLTKPVQK